LRQICLLFLLLGCTGVRKQIHAPPPALKVAAIVVYPVRVLGEEPPGWRTYELSERVIAKALSLDGETFAFFGPSEFQVTRWEDEGAWVASTALPVLVRSGFPADKSLVVRVTAEKRSGSQLQERNDAKGRLRGAMTTEETTWVCTVELSHPSTRTVLVEVSSQVTIDPFATPSREDEFDPAAPMTALLEKLLTEALSVAELYAAKPAQVAPSKVVLAETPAQTASYPDPAVAGLDPLSAELWLQNRARFLSPWLEDSQVPAVARAGRGLLVLEGARGIGVQAGDLIIDVDGALPQRQVLARKRLSVTPVQVKVRRGSAEVESTVP
jgi:hypothetical protein